MTFRTMIFRTMTFRTMTLRKMTLRSTTLQSVLASFILLAAASAAAQSPSTPSPELRKLDYFAGTWTTDATIAAGPWGSGGKFTSTSTNQWKPDGSALICQRKFSMPADLGGDGSATLTMSYDPASHSYAATETNSQRGTIVSKGTLTGDTWTWTSTANYNGMDIQQELTLKPISATSYTLKFETSVDGANWMTFMEGKVTKK